MKKKDKIKAKKKFNRTYTKKKKTCKHEDGLTGEECNRCGFFEGTCDKCGEWVSGDEQEGYES